MVNRYPVGPSSFSDGSSTAPRGKTQHVSSLIVAQQTASLCYEYDTQYPGALERGDRLTVNEAIREKSRMWSLRSAYERFLRGGPWAPLAAWCTWGPPEQWTSTHREEIGTALDLGITQKDGTNRALTPAERAWVDAHGIPRGIRPTGDGFNPPEGWHKNGGYPWTIPPITGVNQPGMPFFTTTTPDKPKEPKGEEDMQFSNEYTKPNRQGRKTTLWIGRFSVVLAPVSIGDSRYSVDDQIKILRKWDKASAASAVTLTTRERQLVQKITRSMK